MRYFQSSPSAANGIFGHVAGGMAGIIYHTIHTMEAGEQFAVESMHPYLGLVYPAI